MASKISERIARAWYESQDFDSRNIEQYVSELADFLDEKGLNEMWQLCQHDATIIPKAFRDISVAYRLASEALRKAGE